MQVHGYAQHSGASGQQEDYFTDYYAACSESGSGGGASGRSSLEGAGSDPSLPDQGRSYGKAWARTSPTSPFQAYGSQGSAAGNLQAQLTGLSLVDGGGYSPEEQVRARA